MRRFLATVLTAAALAAGPEAALAQIGFGPVAAFHDDLDFGLGAYLELLLPDLDDNVRAVGDFVYYFDPGIRVEGTDRSAFEVSGNLTYDLPLEGNDAFLPFVQGGLRIQRWSYRTEERDVHDADLGLNLGGGVVIPDHRLRPTVGLRMEMGGRYRGLVLFGSIGVGPR